MEKFAVDVSELYGRCEEYVRSAVATRGYAALEDIADEETWWTILSAPLMSLIPLEATLHGAVEGLQDLGLTAEHLVSDPGTIDPQPGSVHTEHLLIAHEWLQTVLQVPKKQDQASSGMMLVIGTVDSHGWECDPEALTSMMLAVLLVAGASVAAQ